MLTDLYKGVELLGDSDQEIFTDQVSLGLTESPLRAQLPALRVAATEERNLDGQEIIITTPVHSKSGIRSEAHSMS